MAVEVVKTWLSSAVSEYECCVQSHLHEVEGNSNGDDEKYIKRAPKLLCVFAALRTIFLIMWESNFVDRYITTYKKIK